ncbi:glutathione-disulfide reductase [Rhodomicrobium vannielii]|uniref:glutathione-disulfide reductase n=2 Tax=Rhodomicrobium TaxID=1068 RepID=UPI003D7C2969
MTPMQFDYDLFVIGGGSGGVRAARMAAGTGARVGIAEESKFGGTCVIRGCVPKKLLVYASHYARDFEDAKGYGWTVPPASFDWPTLRDRVQTEVARLSLIYEGVLQNAGAERIHSRAVLDDAHTIRLLADGRTVTAKTILIATGSWPFIPHIHGREHILSSNEAFTLEKLPRSIAIVGGGYIGLEFANIFHGLGVEVTVIYRGAHILRGFDEDIRVGLTEAMQADGIRMLPNKYLARIDQDGADKLIVFEDGGELRAEAVMYATGRMPLTSGMGLMEAGVKLGLEGEVLVDNYSRSSLEHIYAIGDVTDRVTLTPVAIDEAMKFVDTVLRGKPTPVDHTFIPTAVFSLPEIGTVGMSEAQARAQFPEIDIYKARFRPMKYVMAERQERTLMKLVVDARTDMVLGCHIMGPDAAEMAQLLAIPLRLGVRKADFDATMALHPTAGEELVTMREKWLPPAV